MCAYVFNKENIGFPNGFQCFRKSEAETDWERNLMILQSPVKHSFCLIDFSFIEFYFKFLYEEKYFIQIFYPKQFRRSFYFTMGSNQLRSVRVVLFDQGGSNSHGIIAAFEAIDLTAGLEIIHFHDFNP
jgi:hypothetical protein